jgi:hypothetical protein
MPILVVYEGTFYSQLDEASFFKWLESIAGVRKVVGTRDGLMVSLRSPRLSQPALRDLIALHFRYNLPMHTLAQFETAENRAWFRAPHMYWHDRVFGSAAARSNKRMARSRDAASVTLGGSR